MIDTIILRIHNLKKYNVLYEQFYAPAQKRNTTTVAYVDADSGELLQNTYTASLIFHDSNRVLPLTFRTDMSLPSNHYSVSYMVNPSKDYLEFNFSIPKYEYSTNVMQFISLYDQSCSAVFVQLKLFLYEFFRMNFNQQPIHEDIEINRIDLCYNQFFNSKADALTYLDAQKPMLTKYARSSKNNFRSYDTSLMYVTQRYSFKIYHKGTEFDKHDYKELVKNGNPKNLPLQKLKEQADCILRYEMTFRNSMMNYLFNHYFFNSVSLAENPQFSQHKIPKAMRGYMLFVGAPGFEKYQGFMKRFTIRSIWDTPFQHDAEAVWLSELVTFDEAIFSMLYREFWKKVMQYQLTKVLSVPEIIENVKKHNEEIETKAKLLGKTPRRKESLRLILAAYFSADRNLDELKKAVPKQTLLDLKKDLKKIGITDKSRSFNMPTPRVDYQDYKIFFSSLH